MGLSITIYRWILTFNHIITSFLLVIVLQGCVKKPAAVIYINQKADRMEVLAAREIRKYVYQRTGELLPIIEWKRKTLKINNILENSWGKSV